jgi:hypothetical protein
MASNASALVTTRIMGQEARPNRGRRSGASAARSSPEGVGHRNVRQGRAAGLQHKSPPRALAVALAVATPAWADSGSLPDPALTPGAVRTTNVGEICSTSTHELRHWSRDRDDHIMAEYSLPPGPHPQFEVDHLLSLNLGGADSDSNLWPEPRRSIEPTWNAEAKDRLEIELQNLVCSGAVDLKTAQRDMIADWTDAYQKYIGANNAR